METKRRFFAILTLALFGLVVFGGAIYSPVQAATQPQTLHERITTVTVQSTAQAQMQRRAEMEKRFYQALQEKIRAAKAASRFQRAVDREIPAQKKIRLFLDEVHSLKAEGKSAAEIRSMLDARRRSGMRTLAKAAAKGSISGTVKVDGQVPPGDVNVYVFDEHGYYAGSAAASMVDGTYMVDGLPAGDYYVATQSEFVDEFYNDVLLNDFKNWRQATLVSVTAGQTTSNIDFDLAKGAVIRGIITMASTGMPLAYNAVNIKLFAPGDSTDAVSEQFVFTGADGSYEIFYGKTGTFVVGASHPYMGSGYYDGSKTFAGATPITISSPTDIIDSVNIAIYAPETPPVPFPTKKGSMITGNVTKEGTSEHVGFVLVVAFDTADTSVAGIGITGLANLFMKPGAVGMPDYFIAGLDSGSYYVMAVDLINGLSREFYSESSTPDGATPVQVAANDTVGGIDFTLGMGASIAGSVKDAQGNPVSALVLAFKVDTSKTWDPFFTNLDFGFDSTDASGNYQITGLYGGDYIVRTVTMSEQGIMWLDEWYPNVYDLFDAMQAQLVGVPHEGAVSGIDFQLEPASAILGTTQNSDGEPIHDVDWMMLFDANTGKLRFGIFTYIDETTGEYVIAKIPAGDYKIYAFISPSENEEYYSQYYNGAQTFDQATVVTVQPASQTTGIDFVFEKTGVVQGFVKLNAQTAVGADTLYEFPVVLYDANTGMFAGAAKVQFPGGYRIKGVIPGTYKIAAIPVTPPFATTYFGGGTSFDDANSSTVTVATGQVVDADIVLASATGAIEGTVTDEDTGNPINKVLVLAYDATGHIAGAGISGFDIANEQPLPTPGKYQILGLPTGSYYVRTFSLFALLDALNNLQFGEEFNPLELLGGGMPGMSVEPKFYGDEWYDNIPVGLPHIDRDLILRFIQNLRYEEMAVMPLFDPPAAGATVVNVTDGSTTSGIDFALTATTISPQQNPFTGVENSGTAAPSRFELLQSYPNPVPRNALTNGVTITYRLPVQAAVTVEIYNLLGQRVATLVSALQKPGVHHLMWNGKDNSGRLVPNGIYFYSVKAGPKFRAMRKLVVLR